MNQQAIESKKPPESTETLAMKLEELTELLTILNREAKTLPSHPETGKVYFWTVYKEVLQKLTSVAFDELRLATLEEHSVPPGQSGPVCSPGQIKQ